MNNELLPHIMDIKQQLGSHTALIQSIKEETSKTNGRVTKLEDAIIALEKTHSMLARVESNNSGIIKKIQDDLTIEKDAGKRRDITIDELKKIADTAKPTIDTLQSHIKAHDQTELELKKSRGELRNKIIMWIAVVLIGTAATWLKVEHVLPVIFK